MKGNKKQVFERLFKNKNYLFVYLLNIFGAFSNFGLAYPSVSCALYANEVEERIPAIFPVLITCLIQGIVFGKVAVIRYLLFILLYSIIEVIIRHKVKMQDKENGYLMLFIPKVIIISCIVEMILLFTGVTVLNDFANIFAHAVLTIGFSLVFNRGFKYVSTVIANKEEEKITVLNTISFSFMFVSVLSFLSKANIFNLNIWIIASVCILMIYSWKNRIARSILCAIMVFLSTMIFIGFDLTSILLLIVCSIVTTILSRVGKKGAIVGIVISIIYILVAQFNYSRMMEIPTNNEVQQDYLKFVQKETDEDTKEIQKTSEQIETIKNQNSNSITILKSMLVGFVILLAVPEKYLERLKVPYEKKDGFEIFKEKIFSRYRTYKLNPGNPEEEKPVKKKTTSKTTKKKKAKSS